MDNGMTPALVSVVIPAFNGERFIAETLRSVLAQSYPVVEIIVVDDGSSDGTCRLVRDTAPRALLLRQQNARVSAARNRGLGAARGEFVIFLDQDDIWHPEQLARQVAWMQQDAGCGAVVCGYRHWHPTGGAYPAPASIWPPDLGLVTDPDFTGWVYHQFLFDCWALTSGTLMRRASIESAGSFDTTLPYSEDWDLWLRLSRRVPFALLQWPPVLYRQHAVQGSREVRQRDYRTDLLLDHARRHGLKSSDGRAMEPARFNRIVAGYQAEFGYHHLQWGQRWTGVRALAAAWWRAPRQVKRLLLAAAGALGWRPQRPA